MTRNKVTIFMPTSQCVPGRDLGGHDLVHLFPVLGKLAFHDGDGLVQLAHRLPRLTSLSLQHQILIVITRYTFEYNGQYCSCQSWSFITIHGQY